MIADKQFNCSNEADQLEATTMLGINHLDLCAHESLGSRWSIKWSRKSGKQKNVETRRVLYQWCIFSFKQGRREVTYKLTVIVDMIIMVLDQKGDAIPSTSLDVLHMQS
jgi:hypothetical protein